MADENDNIDEAIRTARRMLDAVPDGHVDQAQRLRELGSLLTSRDYINPYEFDEGIQLKRRAVDMTPASPHQAAYLSELADLNYNLYFVSLSVLHLQEAIELERSAIHLSRDDQNRANFLHNLGQRLYSRYRRTRMVSSIEADIRAGKQQVDEYDSEPSPCSQNNQDQAMIDLEEAIQVSKQAVDMIQRDYSARPLWLYDIGVLYNDHYFETQAMEDLEDAIQAMRLSLRICDTLDPSVSRELGDLLGARYMRTGRVFDIEEAINLTRAALARAAPKDSFINLHWLVITLSRLYEGTGKMKHLNEAIDVTRQMGATARQDIQRIRYSSNLKELLLHRYKQTGIMTDLDEAIEMAREVANILFLNVHAKGIRAAATQLDSLLRVWWYERVGVMPSSSDLIRANEQPGCIVIAGTSQVGCLKDLANVLHNRYQKIGKMEDLVELVRMLRHVVAMLPRPSNLVALGCRLIELYEETEDQTAADEAANISKQLSLFDKNDKSLQQSGRLGYLAHELLIRFLTSGDVANLKEAIQLGILVVQMLPDDDQNRTGALRFLSHLYFEKFRSTRDQTDLGTALEYSQQASTTIPQDHSMLGHYLSHHSYCLFHRYRYTISVADLDEAIRIGRQAVDASSDEAHMREVILGKLSTTLYQRYLTTGIVTDLEEAILMGQEALERKVKEPFSGARYFLHQASLLCERHVMTGDLTDLGEAIKLADVTQETVVPPEKMNSHSNLAWIPCQLAFPGFTHMLARDQDHAQILLQKCRDKVKASAEICNRSRALHLSNLVLALSCWILNEKPLADQLDLDEPIRMGRQAIGMAQISHPEILPWHLSCAAIGLRSCFSITKNPRDLAEAISLSQRAVNLAPKDHPGQPFYLIVHAIELHCRYAHTGRLPDLYECIRLGLEAWSLALRGDTLADRHNQFWTASNLACWLGDRYLRQGTISDLERAKEFRRDADGALLILDNSEPTDFFNMHLGTRNTETAVHSPDKEIIHVTLNNTTDCPARLYNLAADWFQHYSEKRDVVSLSSAVLLGQISVDATPRGHMERPTRLEFIGKCLQTRYAQARDADSARDKENATSHNTMKDLDCAIDSLQEVIVTTSHDLSVHQSALHRIGPLYNDRYHYSGDLGDLKMALLVLQQSADVTPRDHSLRPIRLRYLGVARKNSHAIFNKTLDLEAAQRLFQEAVDITPEQCPSHADCLMNLATVYHIQYEARGEIKDLERSLQLYGDSLKAWPDQHHHPLHHKRTIELLSSLGQAYLDKYKVTGTKSDFEQSVQAMGKALDNSSADASAQAIRLVAIANTHLTGYVTMHSSDSTAYLDIATRRLREAADAAKLMSPKNDSDRVEAFRAIGDCYRRKYDATNLKSDLEMAVSFLHEGFRSSSPDSSEETRKFILTAQSLTSALILMENWDEAFFVVDKAVPLIATTSPRFLDISESQACLSKYSCLASDGAAVAVSAGRHAMDSIRLLEEGRAVATVAMNELRVSVPSVAHLMADEKREFLSLCEQMELPSSVVSRTSESNAGECEGEEQSALCKEALRLAAGRKLDSFISDYQHRHKQTAFPAEVDSPMLDEVTADGHIVIVNVSYRCDAFLIKGLFPRKLPLPKLSRESIQDRIKKGNLTSPQVLEWLWDTIAGPVLDALGFTKPPSASDRWPRIWWIATGPLSKFPLHAAGRHFEQSHKTVIDRVISSYSPSIRALRETSKHAYVKSKMTKSQSHKQVQALMVAMEHTPGSHTLPYARKEVAVVSEACKLMSVEPLQLDQRDRQSLLTILRDCEIFHFAGHGFTDASDPSRSHLRLLDWKKNPLTVADIVATNVRGRMPFLAYLSACGTGQIEEAKHLDESIHLISACQLAGFRHVIGTLCEVNDEICVDIARITYEGIRKGGMSDESVCQGLHNAVRELRDRWRDGLTGTARDGKGKSITRRIESSLSAMDRDDGLPRDASPCDEDDDAETALLQWAPYVHYGY